MLTQHLHGLPGRLQAAMQSALKGHRGRLTAMMRELHAVSPLATMQRGYSVLRIPDTQRVIGSVTDISPGDRLEALLADGRAELSALRVEPAELTDADQRVLSDTDQTLTDVADAISKVELRGGLRRALDGAQSVNAYLNAEEPWKLLKTDRERGATVLWTALQAISGLRVALSPYLPFTSDGLGEILGFEPVSVWERPELPGGSKLGEVRPLFTKLEADALDE